MDKNFNPKKITAEHVRMAIKRIDDGLEIVKPSTIFDIFYEGNRYPPKEVMRIAHRLATGHDVWELPGRAPTNNLLKEFGFDIMTKGSDFGKRKNFWKIAPGAQASHWDEFFNEGIMAVGYSENNIGDLKKFKSFTELGKTIGKENSNEARSLWICCHANNGDIVFANKGRNTVVGIGIIDGEYEYQPKREFPHVRKVKWLSNKEWDYVSGQFASDNRNRPTLFRADTLSKTEVGAEILTAYLEKYPEYEDIFVENGVWPVFADGSCIRNGCRGTKRDDVFGKGLLLQTHSQG